MKTETSLLLKGLIIIIPKRVVEYSLMNEHARPENLTWGFFEPSVIGGGGGGGMRAPS